MNIDELFGNVMAVVPAKPIEIMAGMNLFTKILNGVGAESLDIIDMPDVLTYPLYYLAFPENIITINDVFDNDVPITQKYTENMYMQHIASTECYVDKIKELRFGYSLTAENVVEWLDLLTSNWEADTDKVVHNPGNIEPWGSKGLVLEIGKRYRLSYTLGHDDPQNPVGSFSGVTIGGNTYNAASYLTTNADQLPDHVIEFTALTTDGLAIYPDSGGLLEGYVKDVSIISQTSVIQCHVKKQNNLYPSTMDDKFMLSATYYVLYYLYSLKKYEDLPRSTNYFNLYQDEFYKHTKNVVNISGLNWGNE